jgi:hypothetical protein
MSGGETTPQIPTPPPIFPGNAADHSFTLQASFDLQRNFGKVESTVTELCRRVEKLEAAVEKVDRSVHAAKMTVIVVGSILGAVFAAATTGLWLIVGKAADLIVSHFPGAH